MCTAKIAKSTVNLEISGLLIDLQSLAGKRAVTCNFILVIPVEAPHESESFPSPTFAA